MRYRFMASYLGVPYHAGLGPEGTEVTLFSPGPPPEELGFTRVAGYWRKKVSVGEIGSLWQSRLVGEHRGERCLVLDDLGDRLHIAFLGRDTARAGQLGYWEIDREVFEVVVARQEVMGLIEERVDFPLPTATFPPAPSFPGSGPFPVPGAGSVPAPVPAPVRGALPAAATGPFPAVGTGPLPAAATGPMPAAATGPLPAFRERPAPSRGERPTPWPERPVPREERPVPREERPVPREERPTPERAAAWHGSPGPEPWPAPPQPPAERLVPPPLERLTAPPPPMVPPAPPGVSPGAVSPGAGRRTGRRDRVSPQAVFAELLTLAGIPQTAYAVDEEVPGAMCVLKADGGFEVFSRTDDARLDVSFFEDEEAAYFYLFGVLAAEAVRSGRLGPLGSAGPPAAGPPSAGPPSAGPAVNGHYNGSRPGTYPGSRTGSWPGSIPSGSTENVSKYLRCRKLPKLRLSPARVCLAGGADGPPLPKQPRRPP
jgi:hypothetical protein